MKPYETFYQKGFELFKFNSLVLDEVLKDMLEGRIKEGFTLQQKYLKTLDLRPNVIEYSPVFLDVLRENKIKTLIRSRTLRDPTLHHIQVRITNCSDESYMDWHRDTYFDGDKKIGMTPPGLKIIYYPVFNNVIEPRLVLSEGTHRTMLDRRSDDLSIVNKFPNKIISSSKDHALLFDTSVLHAVVPDKINHPSIRVIYSFIAKEQIEDAVELHKITSKLYEDLI